MKTSRLEAFSDAVLAIIITIMVLDLKTPEGSDLSSLRHTTGTAFLTYLLSFIYVAIYWNNHHHMFHLVRHITGGILWANLSLLFFLSLFPFTTSWMASSDFARAPVVLYGVNLLAAAAAYSVLEWVIVRGQGEDSVLRDAIGHDAKGNVSLVLYVAGIASALLSSAARFMVWIGIGLYVVVAILWLVPDRRIERVIRERGIPE